MTTDEEREERAIWKLEQGGYRVQRKCTSYLVTNDEYADQIKTLAELVILADAIYERVWTGRKITPSA